ncbi:MAG: nicotinate-nucleotide adenylyltransferase [Lachnospiraceae bacterium]|nr:nicotinate-nucleotide adenylyltransferase [Lachnospiraceae bacterium]
MRLDQNYSNRKGIMGGTFAPIHNGHLALAMCAYRQFHLDSVLFLPAGNPPHKQIRRDGASDRQRLDMVKLAIRDYPQFSLDAEEMKRDGLSYTKDTLIRLSRGEPDTEFYFIIGADSLMAFDTWYHPEIICEHCRLAVAVRDGLDMGVIRQKVCELQKKYNASVCIMNMPEINLSSTELRKRCREHQSIQAYVPEAVRSYIENHRIYGI